VSAEPRLQPEYNLGSDYHPTVNWTRVSAAPTPG